jgi:alpha/beta superfamily hydrolase
MEEKFFFQSGDIQLEGMLYKISDDKGVVITHPHPAFGGDMYNYVVELIAAAYRKKGYTTFRFNFRGKGESKGSYDNGIGEQDDVIAAFRYLSDSGVKNIDLAGYSFGAWIIAQAVGRIENKGNTVLVSPAINFLDYSLVTSIESLKLVVSGSKDEFAPAGALENMVPAWNKEAGLEIIDGADHFYMEGLDALALILDSYL